MTSSRSVQVRTLTNVRDLETGALVKKGESLELSKNKARRWVALGVAEWVEDNQPTIEKEQEVMVNG